MIINHKVIEQVWMLGNKNNQKFLPSLSRTEASLTSFVGSSSLKSDQYHVLFQNRKIILEQNEFKVSCFIIISGYNGMKLQ